MATFAIAKSVIKQYMQRCGLQALWLLSEGESRWPGLRYLKTIAMSELQAMYHIRYKRMERRGQLSSSG